MRAVKCSECGAGLPPAAPGAEVRCGFCGVVSRMPAHSPPGGTAPYRGASRATISLIVGLLVAGGAILLTSILRSTPEHTVVEHPAAGVPPGLSGLPMPSPLPPASLPGRPAKPQLTLANLATTPFAGREPLEAPGMVGTLEAFDPVANLEWAKAIGRAWAADGGLHRLSVERVERDGRVNLKTTPKAEVMYRFVSPARIREFRESTAMVEPEVNYELFVFVNAEGVLAQKITGGPSRLADYRAFEQLPACTLRQAFDALEKAGKLPPRPVYDADFYVASNRPAWKIDTLTRTPRIPWVEGMKCRVDR